MTKQTACVNIIYDMPAKENDHYLPRYEQDFLPFVIPDTMNPLSPEADEQAKRNWEVWVNGALVETVTEVVLRNEERGITVRYGKRAENYDGIQIFDPGGPVTIPYVMGPDGKILVGLVREYRSGLGGFVENVPRGMLDKGETHDQAAVREMQEETGYKAIGRRVVMLIGGLNANSAYIDTSRTVDDGAAVYAVPLRRSELEQVVDNDGNIYYVFPKHVRDQAEGDSAGERILGSRFIPLEEALKSRDMFTSAAVGQLWVALRQNKVPILDEIGQDLDDYVMPDLPSD